MEDVIPTTAQLAGLYPDVNGKPDWYVESLRNLLQVICSTDGGVPYIKNTKVIDHPKSNPPEVLKTIWNGWTRYSGCSGFEYTGTMVDAKYILENGFEAFKAIRNR